MLLKINVDTVMLKDDEKILEIIKEKTSSIENFEISSQFEKSLLTI